MRSLVQDIERLQQLAEDARSWQNYLMNFGYLPQSDLETGNLRTVDQLRNAIRDLQAFANLNATGELDDATRKLLSTPRCGLPDISASPYRSKRFTLQGQKWHHADLTWSLRTRGPRNLEPGYVRAELDRALNVWSRHSKLTFQEVDSDRADILVFFERGYHGDGYPFDGPGQILAHAFFPGTGRGGDAHFDDEESWLLHDQEEEGTNLFAVAAHEFGHSLGLSHSSVQGALMYPWYQGLKPTFQLPDDDRFGIQQLYGAKEEKQWDVIQPYDPNQSPQYPTQPPQHPNQPPKYPTQPPQHPNQPPQYPTRPPQYHPDQRPQHPNQHPQYPDQSPQYPRKPPYQPTISPNKPYYPGKPQYPVKPQYPDQSPPRHPKKNPQHPTHPTRHPNQPPQYPNHDEDTPQHPPPPPRKPVKPDTCDTSYDAVSIIRQEVFIFKDRYLWRIGDQGLQAGYPVEISRIWKIPENFTHIDAVYERLDKKIVFFIGKKYYLFEGAKLQPGYPRPLSDLGLPTSLESVDAAMVWGHNSKTYFYSGDMYWRYDEEVSKAELDYPRDMSMWRGVGYNIDAVFQWKDGKTYFFKGKKFWKFNDLRMRVESEEPQPSATFWMGCSKKIEATTERVRPTVGARGSSPDEQPSAAGTLYTHNLAVLVAVLILSRWCA